MDRKRLGALLCGVVCCTMAVLVQLTPVLAAELAEPDRQVCLTVETRQNGKAVGGMELSLYRVAQMDEKGQFTLLEPYQASRAQVNELTSSSQWNQTAKTLSAYTSEQAIPADVLLETGKDGICTIDSLESGLYLATAEELKTTEGWYRADPFLVALPMLEDAVWNYAPTVLPKIQFTEIPVTPTPTTLVSPEPSPPVSPEPSTPVSPEPSSTVSPEPSSTASPSPSSRPAVTPAPSPGTNGGLPQTGQLNWPIPVLALLGMILAVAGSLLRRRRE